MKSRIKAHGFSALEVILLIVIITVIGLLGWYVYHLQTDAKRASTAQSKVVKPKTAKQKNEAAEENYNQSYKDWPRIHSSYGNFYLRHAPNWKATFEYSPNTEGRVERIKLMSDNIVLYVDVFDGIPKKPGQGTSKKCIDCLEVTDRKPANSSQIPALEVQRVRYSLDGGTANALILRQKDGTYVLSKSNSSSYLATFRAMSILESNDAYKAEPAEEFAKNPDLGVASTILQRLYYDPYESNED